MAKKTTNAKSSRYANRCSELQNSFFQAVPSTDPPERMADAGDLKKSLTALFKTICGSLGAEPDAEGSFTRSEPRQFTSEQAQAFSRGAASVLRDVAALIEAEHARVEALGGDPNGALWEVSRILLSGEHLGALASLCQDFLYSALQQPIAAE